MAILSAEWQGVLDQSWNSERPMKTLDVRRAREIWARITQRMDLCERGVHAGLVGYSEAEGATRGARAASGGA